MQGFLDVAAYAHPGTGAFGIGVCAEAFYDRSNRGLPPFQFSLCADTRGDVTTDAGLRVRVDHGLRRLAQAEVVMVLPGVPFDYPPSEAFVRAIRRAHERGALIAASCGGVDVLAATGLLDGLRATTHWRWADSLACRYPAITVERNALYVDEGQVVTGAGGGATLDLCLYLIRREHGATVANAVSREMVVPAHRDGGQAQYIAAPVPEDCADDRLANVMAWARENLDAQLSVESLARRAFMSPRSFARHFRATTGATPHAWLLGERLRFAEQLLETTALSIEQIARQVGFANAASLRVQFVRRRGVPPQEYRRTFTQRTLAA